MWFIVSILGFILLSFAAVIDKFLLTKTPIAPLSYAFYICFGSAALSAPLLIFDSRLAIAGSNIISLFIGGASLFFGIYFMFLAVDRSEVSKSNPLITSFIPLSVFILSLILGFELVSWHKIIGTFLVISAGYLLSQVGVKKTHLDRQTWAVIIMSSLLFGASNIYSKIAYNELPFISAFIWLRWFSLFGAIAFVLFTNQWSKLLMKRSVKSEVKQPWLPFILGQTAGSIGTILLQYGIKLGNVILVTALNGIQFLFVILFVYLITKFKPAMLHEDISYKYVAQKIIWSLVLIFGVVLVVI